MIIYSENGKRAVFDGLIFARDDKTGLYLNSASRKRLHRAVWEHFNGSIPAGHHIHHVDGDRKNNNPDNLQCIEGLEHWKQHGLLQTGERRKWSRQNMLSKAIPSAKEWHGTAEGKQWHKKHYESMKDKLHVSRDFVCEKCGKDFKSTKYDSRFCSNSCKAAWRRNSGIDNISKNCPVCGSEFTSNKYAKIQYCSKSCSMLSRHRAVKVV